MLERHFFCRQMARPVIKARPADAEQVRLHREWKRLSFAVNERPALRPG
jgi:hypothetical protein